MAKAIDWMYQRKSCKTCEKARAYLETAGSKIKESVDATKVRYTEAEALALTQGMDKVVAAKGAKITTLTMKEQPSPEDLLAVLMGPTGNLRAPTAKVGKTLLVGFNDEAYTAVVG
jgi:arsenate reductase-like glutaredoxin family protein